MKVLVACECSGRVREQFRLLGHDAWSCDLKPSEDNSPFHFQGNVLDFIKSKKWDLMIAHPPCTHLAVSGARHFHKKKKRQSRAIDFFIKLLNADIPMICLENPVSVASSFIRPPDQIIQPWMFGDKAQKTTCLWLKNLPKLKATKIVGKGDFINWISKEGKPKRMAKWYSDNKTGTSRSRTFIGIAKAMASQWSDPKTFFLPRTFGFELKHRRIK